MMLRLCILLLLPLLSTTAQSADDDWTEFNRLFSNATLQLPDAVVQQSGFQLEFTSLTCTGVTVDDASVTHVAQNVDLAVQFDLECSGKYYYKSLGPFSLIRGSGSATAVAQDNGLALAALVTGQPPVTTTVTSCTTRLNIVDMDFRGGFAAAVAELLENVLDDVIEREVQDVVCQLLQDTDSDLNVQLLKLKERIDPYLQGTLPALPPPELPPTPSTLVDFATHPWTDRLLEQVDEQLATVQPDPNGADLGLNLWLRNQLLNDSGVLQVEPSWNPLLFTSHGILTNTNITLLNLTVAGLDSVQTFESIRVRDAHTMGSSVEWSQLDVTAVVQLDSVASTKQDSLFVPVPEPTRVSEILTIRLGATGVDLQVDVLVAVLERAFGNLPVGSLLETTQVWECTLSVLHALDLSLLQVSVNDFDTPLVSGLVSPGVDAVLENVTKLGMDWYESSILQALPVASAQDGRTWLGAQIRTLRTGTETCPAPLWPRGVVDLPALLQDGSDEYGDLAATGYQALMDRLREPDVVTGQPGINALLVHPLTEAQSNVTGRMVWTELISLNRTLNNTAVLEYIGFRMNNLTISNLDGIGLPLTVLEPMAKDTVTNQMRIGSSDRPLTASTQVHVQLEGAAPFDFNSVLEFSVSTNRLNVEGDLVLRLDGTTLSTFPLRDLLEMECWLASFVQEPGALQVESFGATLQGLDFRAECVACSSQGALLLPSLVDSFSEHSSVLLQDRIPSLAQDLLTSEWLQERIQHRLDQAPAQCRFADAYDADAMRSALEGGFPQFNQESLDTMVYMGISGLWMAVLLFAQDVVAQRPDVTLTDVLQPERAFVPPRDTTLLDWSDVGESTGLGSLADDALDRVREFAADLNGDDDIVRDALDNLLGDTNTITVDTDGLAFVQDDFRLSVDSISVAGLDTITSLNVLEPLGKYTLGNSISLEGLTVDVKVSMGYDAASGRRLQALKTVSLQVELDQVDIDATIFAVFDVDRVRSLPLGSLLLTDNILPCLLSAALDVQIPQLIVNIGSFADMNVGGLLDETGQSIQSFFNVTLDSHRSTLEAAIPRLIEGALGELASTAISDYVQEAKCPAAIRSESEGIVDLRELLLSPSKSLEYGGEGKSPYGNLFSTLLDLVRDEVLAVDEVTGRPKINEMLLRPLTKDQSGSEGKLVFEGKLFDRGTKIDVGGLQAKVRLKIADVFVANIDTFEEPLSILENVLFEPHQLNNSAVLAETEPLDIGVRFLIELIGDGKCSYSSQLHDLTCVSSDTTIHNDAMVNLSLEKIRLVLTAALSLLETEFLAMPLENLANWRCWLAMLQPPSLDARGVASSEQTPSLELMRILIENARTSLNVTCIECSGPDMAEFERLLRTESASDDVTRATNNILDFAMELLEGDFIQTSIDRIVSDSRRMCPSSPEYDSSFQRPTYKSFASPVRKEPLEILLALLVSAVAVAVIVSVYILIARAVSRRRHKKWMLSLSPSRITSLLATQAAIDARDANINEASSSLFMSTSIPLALRLMVPVIVIGNIGFFLSGHLSLGGSVTILANIAGQSFTAANFFEFSMARSAVQIWEAGGKELAILIGIFSGLWPYTKQLITLVVWFLPPKILSVKRRGSILLWLDWLAKWSMLDIFVLVMTLAAFRVSVQSPSLSFLPDNFYSLDLLVIPKWGLYANMIAQLISQVSSHFIIHYHRRAEEVAAKEVDTPVLTLDTLDYDTVDTNEIPTETEQTQRLCTHVFQPRDGRRLVPRSVVPVVVCFCAVCLVGLVAAGCAIPSYSLDILGIVGLLVESGQGFLDAHTYHSVFDTAHMLMVQARFTGKLRDYLGLGTLTSLLVITVLIVPIAQCAALLYAWFGKTTRRQRHRLLIATETLAAWQYVEVFLLGVIVASWQLGPVSEYMINAYCGSLRATFSEMVYFGLLDPDDAQCFRVNTKIENGFYVLVAAALVLAVMNSFVVQALRQVLAEENETKKAPVCDPDSQIEETLRPGPLEFTDVYRVLLRKGSGNHPINPVSTASDEPNEADA